MTRQLQRLRGGAVYQVVAEVTEITSGLNDERPKFKKLLADARIGVLVVEHKNRLTHLGYGYITTLLEHGAGGWKPTIPATAAMTWWTTWWRLSRAWRCPSTAAATPSDGPRRFRHVARSVVSERK